ncbi:MAG TPA: porin [Longimicrobiales bacterium]|nr:porin [Longimicrobiales bacterium]
MRAAIAAVGLWVAFGSAAHAQTLPVNVDVGGRVQFQWNSTSVDDDEPGAPIASSTFETRRVRLGVDIEVGDWIRGAIEPEYALGEMELRQAWLALEFDPAFIVRAGQFKKPFSLVNLTSSTTYPAIERGLRIRGLETALAAGNQGELTSLRGDLLLGEQQALLDVQGYLGYDLGAAVEGRLGSLGWAAGVFNGNGPDARDENDAKSLAARVTYAVDIGAPLTLGGAWSRREMSWPDAEGAETRTGDAFEVDAELGGLREGWWVLAELSSGTNLATRERFLGGQGVLARYFGTGRRRIEGIEPVARVSYGDPDDGIDGDAGVLVTPGVNLYFIGRNRLMFNWDVYLPESDRFETQHAGRAQINLYF